MCEDAFMRTTLDLPDELLKQAKIAAVERGMTLRELVGAALTKELGKDRADRHGKPRTRFPIFSSLQPGSLDLISLDLARIEEEEDLRRHGISR
jgi:hypothetical protein